MKKLLKKIRTMFSEYAANGVIANAFTAAERNMYAIYPEMIH